MLYTEVSILEVTKFSSWHKVKYWVKENGSDAYFAVFGVRNVTWEHTQPPRRTRVLLEVRLKRNNCRSKTQLCKEAQFHQEWLPRVNERCRSTVQTSCILRKIVGRRTKITAFCLILQWDDNGRNKSVCAVELKPFQLLQKSAPHCVPFALLLEIKNSKA